MMTVEKKRRWEAMLARFAASGLSRQAFCEREGISTSAFDYRRRKVAEVGGARDASPFVELTSALSAPALRSDEAEIVFRGGTRLRVGARFPARTLQRLAGILTC